MNLPPPSLSFACVVLGTLAFRLLLATVTVTGFDTYGHLYYATEVKRQRCGPFGAITLRVVGAGDYRHPFLWHWLVGRLPLDWVGRNHKLVNPLLDAAFVVFLYLWARKLGVGDAEATLASALYLTAPLWFSSIAVGPRVATLTPRLPSELLTNLFFILTLVPLGWHPWLSISAAAACASLVLLSSKFGLQALLFLVPAISLVTHTWIPVVALVAAVAASVLATGFDFHRTVRVQLNHLIWYFKKNIRGEMPVSNRNNLRSLRPRHPLRPWLYQAVLTLVQRNSFTAVLIKLPVLVVVLVALVLRLGDAPRSPLWLVGPVVGAVAVYLAVNVRWLLFLGEAERYLNHVSVFICALAVTWATTGTRRTLLHFVIASGIGFGALEVIFLHFIHRRTASAASDRKVLTALRELPNIATVLLYPLTKLGSYRVLLETRHHVIDPVIASDAFRVRFEERYSQDYPYLDLQRLDEMADAYDVDVVVAHADELAKRGLAFWAPSARWKSLALDQSTYRVFTRSDRRS
jgi:hypothetical protein